MANASGSSIHRNRQQEGWKLFSQKLKDLKGKIGCNNDELAIGLGVSRQKYYQFIKNPATGLPIDRANILELWDYLTKDQDEQFRRRETHTLDELLEAAGFRSTLSKNPSFERIRSRLEGPWIQDSTVLSRLVDDIIDLILDRGGSSLESKKDEKSDYNIAEAKKWPEENLKAWTNSRATRRYIQQIDKFVYFGKVKFCVDELYELYQGILENQQFRTFNLDFEAIDCQFRTISFSLPEEAKIETTVIDIPGLCGQAEQELHAHPSSESPPNQQLLPTFPSVIDASVTFNIRDIYQDHTKGEEHKRATFSYACTCTHLESILVALSNGLGYFLSESLLADGSRVLKLGGLFMRSLGDRTDSLTRISTTLIDEENEIYQGLWVEQNAILGFLQTTASAALSWFSEQFNNGETLSEFINVCCRNADVYQNLYIYIDNVYNYGENEKAVGDSIDTLPRERQATNWVVGKINKLINETKELVQDIENLKQNLSLQGQPKKLLKYLNNYRTRLDTKNLLAQTTLIYAYLSQGQLEKADQKLVDLRNKLYRGELAMTSGRHLVPTTILYESSRMLFDLLADKHNFLINREWRSVPSIEILQDPIKELSEYAEKNNTGIIDFDVYLAASLFLHMLGIAEFYVCPSKEIKYLEKAIEQLIKSSHYSAQIGYRQRAARSLCYASRICSRLGWHEAAEQLIESAKKLLIKPRVRFTSYNSNHHILIAEGEKLWSKLSVDKNVKFRDSALIPILCYFVAAWEKSRRYGSPRSEADSLYNIYRVIKKLSENSNEQINVLVDQSINIANSEPHSKKLFLKEFSSDRSYSEICSDIFSDYLEAAYTYKQTSDALKERVKAFWNSGAQISEQESKQHLFSRMIDNGTFLAVIS
ncbi:MAG: hypothetical protein F6J86_36580 [Symploca sp. SIO1B1]|nr:hypothetical protein [Symploca sp. SIO1C2]NER99278.1 hypothetical protein [Symploca sp. SIO1B1]